MFSSSVSLRLPPSPLEKAYIATANNSYGDLIITLINSSIVCGISYMKIIFLNGIYIKLINAV